MHCNNTSLGLFTVSQPRVDRQILSFFDLSVAQPDSERRLQVKLTCYMLHVQITITRRSIAVSIAFMCMRRVSDWLRWLVCHLRNTVNEYLMSVNSSGDDVVQFQEQAVRRLRAIPAKPQQLSGKKNEKQYQQLRDSSDSNDETEDNDNNSTHAPFQDQPVHVDIRRGFG